MDLSVCFFTFEPKLTHHYLSTNEYTVSPIDEVKTTPWSGGRSPFNVEYGKMMMWFFLLSDAFTFSSLLISYGALAFQRKRMASGR
jgi:heme/copper-type cytochrome/quinol oxidase subunit 3